LKSLRSSPTVGRDFPSQQLRRIEEFAPERMAHLEKDLSQLPLKVLRKDGMRNGPADDGEVFGPRPSGFGTAEYLVELMVGVTDEIPVAVGQPAGVRLSNVCQYSAPSYRYPSSAAYTTHASQWRSDGSAVFI
jgi:hypothetical protein